MSELETPPNEIEQEPQPIPASVAAPATAQPPVRRSRTGLFFLGAFSGCLIAIGVAGIIAVVVMAGGAGSADLSLSANKVAVVPIEGEIVDARDTIEALERYADTPTVRAIVVRINSPGGAIAPSQEIYAAIGRIRRESGKPIVASFDSVAASGGFYVAAACDRIVANPGSITGSIGVILQWFEIGDLVRWAKMNPETITSGAMKDAGSPYREMTPAERAYFEGIVKQLHEQFVRDVARGRGGKMQYAEVARIADGRVVTGEEALRLKLVDQLGGLDEAVRAAGKLAGIKGEPDRLWPRPRVPGLLDLLTETDAEALTERVLSRRLPQFLYRW
jgi:protease-4